MLWAPHWQRGRLYLSGLHPTDSDRMERALGPIIGEMNRGTTIVYPEEEKDGVGKGSHCLENSGGF